MSARQSRIDRTAEQLVSENGWDDAIAALYRLALSQGRSSLCRRLNSILEWLHNDRPKRGITERT
jgi:hypothetical protein